SRRTRVRKVGRSLAPSTWSCRRDAGQRTAQAAGAARHGRQEQPPLPRRPPPRVPNRWAAPRSPEMVPGTFSVSTRRRIATPWRGSGRGADLLGALPRCEQVLPGANRGGVRVGVQHPADHRGSSSGPCSASGSLPIRVQEPARGLENVGVMWVSLDGLPFPHAQRVTFDPADPAVIYVSTFGGSVWKGPAE